MLRRVSVDYVELLRDLLPRQILSSEALTDIERVLAAGSPAEIRRTAQRVIQSLVDSGHLDVLEQVSDEAGRWLRLHEPSSRLRFAVWLDAPSETEGLEVIPLPLEPSPAATVKASVIRDLHAGQGSLVRGSGVATPAEIIEITEQTLRDSMGVDRVSFLPIDYPQGELWESERAADLAVPESRLRELVRSRDYLLRVRDFSRLNPLFGAHPRTGSALFIGIGDEMGGWRAVIEARDAREGYFTQERIGLAVLLCRYFETLLANAVRLDKLIFIDKLTGLYNRSQFEDQFPKQVAYAQRGKQSLALCIADIDEFKSFNSRFGLPGGDLALATVANILKGALRTSDTIARIGGEEFAALLLPPVTREGARAVAERLREAIETESFNVQGLDGKLVSAPITISIGGALLPDDASTPDDLWRAASQMLLDAKRLGRNRVCFYGDEFTSEMTNPQGG